jgi:hypothetical protein
VSLVKSGRRMVIVGSTRSMIVVDHAGRGRSPR